MIAMRSMLASMTWSVKTSVLLRMEQALTRPNVTVDVALGRAFRRAEAFMDMADLAFVRARFVLLWLPTRLIVLKVGCMAGRWVIVSQE